LYAYGPTVRTERVAGGEVVLLRPGEVVGAVGPPGGVADGVLRRAGTMASSFFKEEGDEELQLQWFHLGATDLLCLH